MSNNHALSRPVLQMCIWIKVTERHSYYFFPWLLVMSEGFFNMNIRLPGCPGSAEVKCRDLNQEMSQRKTDWFQAAHLIMRFTTGQPSAAEGLGWKCFSKCVHWPEWSSHHSAPRCVKKSLSGVFDEGSAAENNACTSSRVTTSDWCRCQDVFSSSLCDLFAVALYVNMAFINLRCRASPSAFSVWSIHQYLQRVQSSTLRWAVSPSLVTDCSGCL